MGKDQELIDAARSGKYNVVEKLLGLRAKRSGPLASLRRGPGPNVQDNSGYSALHHASLNGHKDIVELLLQYEASTNIVDHKGSSPLHLAAWSGNVEVVKLLLSRGPSVPNVNLTNNDDENALHCAAQYGHTEVVNLLLEHNVDPSIRNLKNETPLDLAAQYGRLETVELLVRTHPELLRHFLKPKDRSSTLSKRFMHTPLHSASRNGHRSVVQVLIESGFDVNTLTPSGTALHEAAICGKVEVVRLLLEEGIDISLTDTSGRSVIELLSELNTTITQEIYMLITNNVKVIENCDKEDSNNANSFTETSNEPHLVNGRSRLPVPNTLDVPLTPSTSTEFDPSPVMFSAKSVDSSFVSDYSDTTSLQSTLRGTPTPTQEADGMSLGSNSSDSNTHPSSRFVPAENDFSWQYQELIPTPTGENDPSGGIANSSATTSPSGKPTPPKKPPRRSVAPPSPTSQDFACNSDFFLPESSFDNDSLIKLFEKSSQLVDIRPPKQLLSGCVDIYQNGDEEAGPPALSDQSSIVEPVKHVEKEKKKSSHKRFITSAYIKLRASQENLFKRDKLKAVKSDDELEIDRTRKQRESVPRPGSFDFDEVRKEIMRNSKTKPQPLKYIPISPTHYQQPPTPDHPPPTAKQAESSIHEMIRPLSQELKRLSKDIETETEEELFTPWDVSSGSLSSGASISDKSVSTDNIEEFAGDSPFAGLYKGSACYVLENGGDKLKSADRPKSLQKFTEDKNISLEGENSSNEAEGSDSRRSKNSRPAEKTLSLSILSPFDEQEEWTKISEIMASYTKGLSKNSIFFGEIERELQNRIGRTNNKCTEVGLWLEELGLREYEGILVRNGYDNLNFLGGNILENQDLIEMGVTNSEHRSVILESVASLPCSVVPLSSNPNSHTVTLEEWLTSINLENYIETFRKNFYIDMDKVRKMWEVELTTVLEITILGHKKRILVSLGDAPRKPYLECADLSADLAKLDTEIKELNKVDADSDDKTAKCSTLGRQGRHKKSRPAPPPPIAPNSDTSETVPVDIAIRDPSQLVVGVPSALTTNWRHEPKSLVSSTCDYFVQYLGSTLVKELRGTESTKKSIQKLKKSTLNVSKIPNIILGISYNGVKFLDANSRDLVCTHLIRNIHCACQDADDLRHFAYITRDHLTGKHYCHVFAVSNMDTATEIILTLGQAFEVAYQIALQGQMRHEKSGHNRSQSLAPRSSDNESSHIRSLSAHIVPHGKTPLNGDTDALLGNAESSGSSSSSSVSMKNSSVVENTTSTMSVK